MMTMPAGMMVVMRAMMVMVRIPMSMAMRNRAMVVMVRRAQPVQTLPQQAGDAVRRQHAYGQNLA